MNTIPCGAGEFCNRATIGMLLWGHCSDKKNERRWNLTASCAVMGLGCITAALLTGSYWSLLGLSLITIGLYASNAHLFPLPAVSPGSIPSASLAAACRLRSWDISAT